MFTLAPSVSKYCGPRISTYFRTVVYLPRNSDLVPRNVPGRVDKTDQRSGRSEAETSTLGPSKRRSRRKDLEGSSKPKVSRNV